MAQQVHVETLCDMDPNDKDAKTRNFSLDGRDYEIDLCEAHAGAFNTTMQRFTGHARKAVVRLRGSRSAVPHHIHDSTGLTPAERTQVRAWAKDNGKRISQRGRIGAGLIAEWREAQQLVSQANTKPPQTETTPAKASTTRGKGTKSGARARGSRAATTAA